MISKFKLFDPLHEWMNGHCGCVELVEYFSFDYLHVTFGVWIKSYSFLKLRDGQTQTTVLVLQFPATPFRRGNKGEKGRGREGKLGHAVRRCCSSPKNRLGFLSSFRFSHLHGFSSLFMVVPPCVVQLGGTRRITVTLAAKQTVGNRCWDCRRRRCLCCLQGKTLGETCSCCRTCFPSGIRDF